MRSAIVFCCLIAIAFSTNDSEWENFKIKFGRKYKSPTEEYYRKKIFLNNKLTIDRHNQRYAEGRSTFTLGINQLADLTTKEYNDLMNGYKMNKRIPSALIHNTVAESNNTSVDWRTSGCISPVEDQGQCGSCWAFSTTGSTEFVNCQSKGTLNVLSEQNLIDCTYSYGNTGCDGGSIVASFQYIIDTNGIDTEESYPYTGTSTSTECKYAFTSRGGTLTGYIDVTPSSDESVLQNAVDISAVSASIDASQESFQLYSSGLYDEPLCSSTELNHAILIVGYGTNEEASDFWLVKNSWGTSWGEQGYINMSRNKNNQCGIATEASYPLLEEIP
ncbi:hypothetical protein CHUAL_013791 [Chamberlinius hualienensis]